MNPSRRTFTAALLAGCAAGALGAVTASAADAPASRPATSPGPATRPLGRTIKQASAGRFVIGTAGDIPGNYSDAELALVKEHFEVVTPENCMKPGPIHPEENTWRFERPDALVKWCADNKLGVHGHTLVWHAQTNDWFYADGDKAATTRRLKDHIATLVTRYKGRIGGWDVVNEAISDRGDAQTAQTENLRNSRWLQTLGPEFITLAFQFAHEADPDAQLYYNDYNIERGAKHASSMALLRRLLASGAPVHGVGIQGHWSTASTPFDEIDKAIANYASLGLKVSITELDVTIRGASGGQLGGPGGGPGGGGPGPGGGGRPGPGGPGPGGRPRTRPPATPASPQDLQTQADVYAKLFAIFDRHKAAIDRVTFWGLSDRRSWRAGQHPLVFDANNQPKPAYDAIVAALRQPNPDANPKP